jgi:hypothetical protein
MIGDKRNRTYSNVGKLPGQGCDRHSRSKGIYSTVKAGVIVCSDLDRAGSNGLVRVGNHIKSQLD